MTARRRVYVVYAGGTIGMRATEAGYAPVPGYLSAAVAGVPELVEAEVPELLVNEHAPLLDSANARPADWLAIARDIAARARTDEFDGFVVLHGTDTMAYTASALAFLLRGLGRPVVVTGAQIPIGVLRSDGRQNLLTAVLVAARADVREVCLVFGSRILRGCRAVKESASGFEAFSSPNLPPLGSAGVEIALDPARLQTPEPGGVRLPDALDAPVRLLRLYPGMPADLLRAALAPPARGLVLEAYGAGNLPDRDPELLAALAEGAARGVVVVAVSQCLDGRVDLGAYAASAPLVAAGAVGGLDLTTEAAYAKLVVLLSEGHPPSEVRTLMTRDLCGELTS
jgi:L-asparaginase